MKFISILSSAKTKSSEENQAPHGIFFPNEYIYYNSKPKCSHVSAASFPRQSEAVAAATAKHAQLFRVIAEQHARIAAEREALQQEEEEQRRLVELQQEELQHLHQHQPAVGCKSDYSEELLVTLSAAMYICDTPALSRKVQAMNSVLHVRYVSRVCNDGGTTSTQYFCDHNFIFPYATIEFNDIANTLTYYLRLVKSVAKLCSFFEQFRTIATL